MGAGIRRVRTPAGVRRFGRPIGAPILPGEGGADLRPRLRGPSPVQALAASRPGDVVPDWRRRAHWVRGADGSWLIDPGEAMRPIHMGALIEVHRRDGSSSWHVVGEQVGNRFRSVREATPAEIRAWLSSGQAVAVAREVQQRRATAPEVPKGRWKRRRDGSWVIEAPSSDYDEGDIVEVSRRDGSSSWHVLGERLPRTNTFQPARRATPEEVAAWRRRQAEQARQRPSPPKPKTPDEELEELRELVREYDDDFFERQARRRRSAPPVEPAPGEPPKAPDGSVPTHERLLEESELFDEFVVFDDHDERPAWRRKPHWVWTRDGAMIAAGVDPIHPGDVVEVFAPDGTSSWYRVGEPWPRHRGLYRAVPLR